MTRLRFDGGATAFDCLSYVTRSQWRNVSVAAHR